MHMRAKGQALAFAVTRPTGLHIGFEYTEQPWQSRTCRTGAALSTTFRTPAGLQQHYSLANTAHQLLLS